MYSFYDEKWHGYFTTPLLTSIEMSTAQTVQEILNYGANIKTIAKTSHGGDLGVKYLGFFSSCSLKTRENLLVLLS